MKADCKIIELSSTYPCILQKGGACKFFQKTKMELMGVREKGGEPVKHKVKSRKISTPTGLEMRKIESNLTEWDRPLDQIGSYQWD